MAKVSVYRLCEELVFDRGRTCVDVSDPKLVTRLDSTGAAAALLRACGASEIDRDEHSELWDRVDDRLVSLGEPRAPVAILRGQGTVWAVTRSDTPRKPRVSEERNEVF